MWRAAVEAKSMLHFYDGVVCFAKLNNWIVEFSEVQTGVSADAHHQLVMMVVSKVAKTRARKGEAVLRW